MNTNYLFRICVYCCCSLVFICLISSFNDEASASITDNFLQSLQHSSLNECFWGGGLWKELASIIPFGSRRMKSWEEAFCPARIVLLNGDVEKVEANLSALHPFSVRYVRKHFQTQFQNAQINYYCIAPDIEVLTWS